MREYMKVPYTVICEPHRDSPFTPYRLATVTNHVEPDLCVVRLVGDPTIEHVVPRGWFTFYSETQLPGWLDAATPFERADFHLSRAHGIMAARHVHGPDDPKLRPYLIDVLADRGVDASQFDNDTWRRLLKGLRYNHYD